MRLDSSPRHKSASRDRKIQVCFCEQIALPGIALHGYRDCYVRIYDFFPESSSQLLQQVLFYKEMIPSNGIGEEPSFNIPKWFVAAITDPLIAKSQRLRKEN